MAIYESETVSRTDLEAVAKRNRCAVCGGRLWLYLNYQKKLDGEPYWRYLSCDQEGHEGIARGYREPSAILKKEYEDMVTKTGTNKLALYVGKRELQKNEAKEIIESLFPDAPKIEQERAILTCVSYRLNPLNKHVFLIPFNRKNKEGQVVRTDWALVMGIKAKRLLANRPVPGSAKPRPFSYIDNTPRVMTPEEQMTIFGEVLQDRVSVITKLQDPETHAVVVGYGSWRKSDAVYGTEKGNTAFNMAAIRSESQALDRLRPGEMPEGVETADESVIEGQYRVVDTSTGEVIEGQGKEEEVDLWQGNTPTAEEENTGAPAVNPTIEADKTMIRSAASKLKWDSKRLDKEIKERTGCDHLDDMPADKLHDFASKVADLASVT